MSLLPLFGGLFAFSLLVGCIAGLWHTTRAEDKAHAPPKRRPVGGLLKALEVRPHDPQAAEGTGYFVRTKLGARLGPMSEAEFEQLRCSDEVREVSSAWRIAGGSFYKVRLQRFVAWDAHHACSERACGRVCEALVVAATFWTAVFIFRRLPAARWQLQAKPGEVVALLHIVDALLALAVFFAALTLLSLVRQWRRESTDVFVSEV